MTKISYAGYRFPPVIIQQAIWLYVRFTLSFRDVEDLLAERGIIVSYERRCHVVECGTQGSAISHTFKRRRLRRRAKCSSPMREKLGVWRPMSDGVGR